MIPAYSTSARGKTRDLLSTKDQYVAQRARGAYIASVCQPEAAYDLSIAPQVSQEPTDDQIKALNKRIRWQIDKTARGLRFIPLNHGTLRLVTYTNTSHANNKDLSSQIG
jgi:hypothetical protein